MKWVWVNSGVFQLFTMKLSHSSKSNIEAFKAKIVIDESVSTLDGLDIDAVLEAICPNCETVEIETSTSSMAFAVDDSILSTNPLSGVMRFNNIQSRFLVEYKTVDNKYVIHKVKYIENELSEESYAKLIAALAKAISTEASKQSLDTVHQLSMLIGILTDGEKDYKLDKLTFPSQTAKLDFIDAFNRNIFTPSAIPFEVNNAFTDHLKLLLNFIFRGNSIEFEVSVNRQAE